MTKKKQKCLAKVQQESLSLKRVHYITPDFVDNNTMQRNGKGGHNDVFTVDMKQHCLDKQLIIYRRSLHPIQNIEYFKEESEIAIRMANYEIGPDVYSAYIDKNGHGVIIMERYEYDLEYILYHHHQKNDLILNIYKDVVRIIDTMANVGICCIDQKPSNVVVSILEGEHVKVRLIDFGTDLCTTQHDLSHHLNIPRTIPSHIISIIMLIVHCTFINVYFRSHYLDNIVKQRYDQFQEEDKQTILYLIENWSNLQELLKHYKLFSSIGVLLPDIKHRHTWLDIPLTIDDENNIIYTESLLVRDTPDILHMIQCGHLNLNIISISTKIQQLVETNSLHVNIDNYYHASSCSTYVQKVKDGSLQVRIKYTFPYVE
jgi:hypothetical protein